MHVGTILANASALLFCLALCALFVWQVDRICFMGTLVTGLVVPLTAYRSNSRVVQGRVQLPIRAASALEQ